MFCCRHSIGLYPDCPLVKHKQHWLVSHNPAIIAAVSETIDKQTNNDRKVYERNETEHSALHTVISLGTVAANETTETKTNMEEKHRRESKLAI